MALAIAVMIGDGCCAFVSISLGKGEVGETRKSVGSAVVLSVASSLVLTALYLIFADAIISMFGGTVNEETFHYAQEYFFYISLGIPFYMFGQAMNPVIRADGNPRFAMISTLAGAVLNIILDPIFIFECKWGMMGAAVATVLGQIVTAALAVWYLCRMKAVKPGKGDFRLHASLCTRMLTLGITSFLSQISLVAAMEYFKAEVMEMCHRENLYQIDLLHGSKNRITEREYWAQKKGQAKLDKENATLAAEGQPVKQTKFETDKAKLRQTIRNAMSEATTFDEFSALLLRQGVIVKESRGRLSYLAPDRTKPITARKLGDDFDRAAVLALLEQNAHRAAEKTAPIPEYHTAETNRTERGKTQKIAPTGNIQRMVDRAAKRAEGKGIGYDRWAAVHNLKQMAATVAAMEQYGFTPDELDAALVSANADLHSSTAKLKPIETAIREKKDLQKQVLAYAKTRDVRDGLKKQKTDKARKAYREKHESDFIIADAAVRYFRQKGITKLPTYKSLQAEIEQLTAEKNALYNEYRANKERVRELQTMKSNLSQMHHGEPSRQKKHEQER